MADTIKVGDTVKQCLDLVTVWKGPNGRTFSDSDFTYIVTDVFASEITGDPHLLATGGGRHTGGPVTHFTRA